MSIVIMWKTSMTKNLLLDIVFFLEKQLLLGIINNNKFYQYQY